MPTHLVTAKDASGATVSLQVEDNGASLMPVAKIHLGAADVDGGAVTTANPFPVSAGASAALFPTASLQRPADTTAYAVNDVLGVATTGNANYLTLTNCVTANGKTGTIVGVSVTDSRIGTTVPLQKLVLLSAAPTANCNDNAAWNPNATDLGNIVAEIDVSSFSSYAGNGLMKATELFQPFACAVSSSSLYLVPIIENAYTPGSAETWVYTLKILPNA